MKSMSSSSSSIQRSHEREGASPSRDKRTLLVCLPFHSHLQASIATAGLATYLRREGAAVSEVYLHLDFLGILGEERYERITQRRNGQTAELLFAEAMTGEIVDEKWQGELTALVGPREERRAVIERFERRCLARVAEQGWDIIGMTTSYNQLVPALWLARLLKQRSKESTIVLGGTACAEPMGRRIAAAYPEVDYVVSGYGEHPLLALSRGERPADRVIQSPAPLEWRDSPLPDYRPFLRELEEMAPGGEVYLLVQSSRGCWWGEKERRHCTFCGLNGSQLAFSAKSSERVVAEVRTLFESHGRHLIATDCILSRDHLRQVVPTLAKFERGPFLFYEMKSNMNEADVAMLKRARVIGQVGIESLSTRLLRLMNKGVSAIRNLALLKWCRERKVMINWNQLAGIPGENDADYDEQIALMEKIPHFPPPAHVNPVVIDRYSPYFERYREFGWKEIRPVAQCRLAHPNLKGKELAEIAYHFEGVGGVTSESYIERFDTAVSSWIERHKKGLGLFLDPYEGLVRVDEEGPDPIPLDETMTAVIAHTHKVTPISKLLDETGCGEPLIRQMVEEGVLHQEGKRVLNLTVRTKLPDLEG
jgi:ribosomal peptide maturation radical SAM protein 1